MTDRVAVAEPVRSDRIHHVRQVLSRAGTLAAGGPLAGVPPSPESPFGEAAPIEGDVVVAMPVPEAGPVPETVGFCDGFQRFSIEGWVGICPVVRASVSAAAMLRTDRELAPVTYEAEEFLVAPLNAIDADVVADLRSCGLPLYDPVTSERRHPSVDLRNAVQFVQSRRHACEVAVARSFRDLHPDVWLVVDGSLRGYEKMDESARLLGVIKSHETQYLAGADLEVALTLGVDHRTSVFERRGANESPVYTWYVRLWEWAGHDLLYGLVRLERPSHEVVVEEADAVSRWILSERAPLAGDNRRWDRFLYPVYRVESYLRARAGGWM